VYIVIFYDPCYYWTSCRTGPLSTSAAVLVQRSSLIMCFVISTQGTETVQVTPLRRTLASSPESECASPSVLWHCWLGGRKGIRPVKNGGMVGGEHWLVRMEWRPAGWSVCLPLLIFPCTVKSRSSLLAPPHPGGPGKRAVKWLWWWCHIFLEFVNFWYLAVILQFIVSKLWVFTFFTFLSTLF